LKSVVLLSGGLDSTVNFKCAIDEGEVTLALTFDYGQAAFANEMHAAADCAQRYGVRHQVSDLTWYRDLLPGPIAGEGMIISHDDGLAVDRQRLLNEAWVPNRNCVLLSIGAAFAEALDADGVVIGLNREEAETFPDNSRTFLEAMNRVLAVSSLGNVRIVSYTVDMSKSEIVELGQRIDAPLDIIYSCYRRSGDQRMCGSCQSCTRLKSALRENGLLDRLAGRFAR
jgi:7-cyano-7-deazaguanine synthase